MLRTPRVVLPFVVAVLVPLAPAAAASATTPLRLDGIGPLRLGMTRVAAVETGWLSNRTRGCELASPRPVTYRLAGAKAPNGLRGSAEFSGGKLRSLSFTAGVRTATGVTVGTTTARLVAAYRRAGFQASSEYVDTFQGTFGRVKRMRRDVLGSFAEGSRTTMLAIPRLSVCE